MNRTLNAFPHPDYAVAVQFDDDLKLTEVMITLRRPPSHVCIAKRKMKADKHIKIGGQQIYNGRLHHNSRAVAMNEMHKYLMQSFSVVRNLIYTSQLVMPKRTKLFVVFGLPVDYGNVALRMTKQGFKFTGGDGSSPCNWDLDNLAWIWNKAIQDELVHQRILDSDTAQQLSGLSYQWVQVPHFKDRYIRILLAPNP